MSSSGLQAGGRAGRRGESEGEGGWFRVGGLRWAGGTPINRNEQDRGGRYLCTANGRVISGVLRRNRSRSREGHGIDAPIVHPRPGNGGRSTPGQELDTAT